MSPLILRRGRPIAVLVATMALVSVALVTPATATATTAAPSAPTIKLVSAVPATPTPNTRIVPANQPVLYSQQRCSSVSHDTASNDYTSTATINGHNVLQGYQFITVPAGKQAIVTHEAKSGVLLKTADGTITAKAVWTITQPAGPDVCRDLPPKCKIVNLSTPMGVQLTVDLTKYCTDKDGDPTKMVLSDVTRASYGGAGTTRNAAGKKVMTYENDYCKSGAKDHFFFDVRDDMGVDSGAIPVNVTITDPLTPPQFPPVYLCG